VARDDVARVGAAGYPALWAAAARGGTAAARLTVSINPLRVISSIRASWGRSLRVTVKTVNVPPPING